MTRVFISRDSTAVSLGADRVAAVLRQSADARGLQIEIVRTGSRGLFWLEPLVEVQTDRGRIAYGPVQAKDLASLIDAGLMEGKQHPLYLGDLEALPYFKDQHRLTFARVGITDPVSLDDYLAHDGYRGLRNALAMSRQEIVQQVIDSGLRGRGGAAFPTDGHPVFASMMKRRLREGAKLIVVDPRNIDLVRTPHIQADFHLKLRPGTNVAVANALAHVVVTEGLTDERFVAKRCDTESFAKWKTFIVKPENSPEAVAEASGIPAETLRSAARLYATGGNSAIYYGLGVTEHSQGSTTVIAIANLAMATGNIGREGVGVNPLRGQNNVQGSCDMGSFPHEFVGYRHVSDEQTRLLFESAWGVTLQSEPGLRIPNMFAAAIDGSFKGLYVQGEDIAQSDPDIQHVHKALGEMECIIVQDLFLNETAKFAHVFLPGSSFLEKNGTFTNAERRISPVRKVMRGDRTAHAKILGTAHAR
ncbi:MAG: molybdopterin-dependent oxidoreductase [Methylococcaceae bacterium]|nr:molybdopterin-dependent oxidoreductase [Methylococcaceae bacterium]MCI0732686.1 molybdopterin-dependent oxidoreductase [Methylococcaceae bacterium]